MSQGVPSRECLRHPRQARNRQARADRVAGPQKRAQVHPVQRPQRSGDQVIPARMGSGASLCSQLASATYSGPLTDPRWHTSVGRFASCHRRFAAHLGHRRGTCTSNGTPRPGAEAGGAVASPHAIPGSDRGIASGPTATPVPASTQRRLRVRHPWSRHLSGVRVQGRTLRHLLPGLYPADPLDRQNDPWRKGNAATDPFPPAQS
jgi:hypothetical protein